MDFEAQRASMVDRLDRRGHVTDPQVCAALRGVPRHEFVPEGSRRRAYDDKPLPIGNDQTVSAPHMVGTMCELLNPAADDRVLEIGTGCGYHAAVTAELVPTGHVYSVEYDGELAERARETLARVGYGDRVSVRVGDGREGWPEHAPYDAAYLTCAAAEIPRAVREQVRPGGRVVAPVGDGRQRLVVLDRRADGSFEREDRGGVRFVRMRGDGPE
jgi:protein-L-isoaspartate(D-aspartate) O-methyltransferase